MPSSTIGSKLAAYEANIQSSSTESSSPSFITNVASSKASFKKFSRRASTGASTFTTIQNDTESTQLPPSGNIENKRYSGAPGSSVTSTAAATTSDDVSHSSVHSGDSRRSNQENGDNGSTSSSASPRRRANNGSIRAQANIFEKPSPAEQAPATSICRSRFQRRSSTGFVPSSATSTTVTPNWQKPRNADVQPQTSFSSHNTTTTVLSIGDSSVSENPDAGLATATCETSPKKTINWRAARRASTGFTPSPIAENSETASVSSYSKPTSTITQPPQSSESKTGPASNTNGISATNSSEETSSGGGEAPPARFRFSRRASTGGASPLWQEDGAAPPASAPAPSGPGKGLHNKFKTEETAASSTTSISDGTSETDAAPGGKPSWRFQRRASTGGGPAPPLSVAPTGAASTTTTSSSVKSSPFLNGVVAGNGSLVSASEHTPRSPAPWKRRTTTESDASSPEKNGKNSLGGNSTIHTTSPSNQVKTGVGSVTKAPVFQRKETPATVIPSKTPATANTTATIPKWRQSRRASMGSTPFSASASPPATAVGSSSIASRLAVFNSNDKNETISSATSFKPGSVGSSRKTFTKTDTVATNKTENPSSPIKKVVSPFAKEKEEANKKLDTNDEGTANSPNKDGEGQAGDSAESSSKVSRKPLAKNKFCMRPGAIRGTSFDSDLAGFDDDDMIQPVCVAFASDDEEDAKVGKENQEEERNESNRRVNEKDEEPEGIDQAEEQDGKTSPHFEKNAKVKRKSSKDSMPVESNTSSKPRNTKERESKVERTTSNDSIPVKPKRKSKLDDSSSDSSDSSVIRRRNRAEKITKAKETTTTTIESPPEAPARMFPSEDKVIKTEDKDDSSEQEVERRGVAWNPSSEMLAAFPIRSLVRKESKELDPLSLSMHQDEERPQRLKRRRNRRASIATASAEEGMQEVEAGGARDDENDMLALVLKNQEKKEKKEREKKKEKEKSKSSKRVGRKSSESLISDDEDDEVIEKPKPKKDKRKRRSSMSCAVVEDTTPAEEPVMSTEDLILSKLQAAQAEADALVHAPPPKPKGRRGRRSSMY